MNTTTESEKNTSLDIPQPKTKRAKKAKPAKKSARPKKSAAVRRYIRDGSLFRENSAGEVGL
jgi:hypothetical protein